MPINTREEALEIFKDVIERWGLMRISQYVDGPLHSIEFGTWTLHREDGPAYIWWHETGKIAQLSYCRNGDLHRVDGPAKICCDTYGNISECMYCIDGQLHRENGPAEFTNYGSQYNSNPPEYYLSNRKRYYIRGVLVNEQIVMRPETLTVQKIHDIQNIEAKRIAIEKFGWFRYLAETHAVTIDERIDEVSGTNEALIYTSFSLVGEFVPAHFLLCSCPSTGRIYPVEVPIEIQTCNDAQEYLRGERLRNISIIGAS